MTPQEILHEAGIEKIMLRASRLRPEAHLTNDILIMAEPTLLFEAMELYASHRCEVSFPITVSGWTITPEDEPWSEEHQGNKFKATCDGEVKAAKTLSELVQEIFGETEDYFYKAIDGFKADLTRKTELLKRVDTMLGAILITAEIPKLEGLDDLLTDIDKEIK